MDYQVYLKINGKDIALNPFVRKIFQGVCAGLVDSLDRLPEERDRVEIVLTRESAQISKEASQS